MLKISKRFLFFGVLFMVFNGCTSSGKKNSIRFEIVNDSLYNNPHNYNTEIKPMKDISEKCLGYSLFQNAFYMGLQENVHIGSISNKNATNVNKQFTLFDSSNRQNLVNLFAPVKGANCYAKLNLSKDLQRGFYNALIKSLKETGQYQYLADYLDSNRITFKIASIADNGIRPDSLADLLNRTQDSSLLQFKKTLLDPGNVFLSRTIMIFGFYVNPRSQKTFR